MAIYLYKCLKCESLMDVVQSIKEYCIKPNVPECSCGHGAMQRVITAPMVSFDKAPWNGYLSPLDGKTFVDSRAKEREMMARHGVVPYQEIAPDFERNRKRVLQEAASGTKEAIIEATQMVEQGYKPQVATELIPEG